MNARAPKSPAAAARSEAIADAAIGLLVSGGLRALTHRAVDEAAGLPQGSTSNHARTRAALIEATLRRLAVREARVVSMAEMPRGDDAEELADGLSLALHRYLTRDPTLLVARYELALESTRRPELRETYVRTGTSAFREPLTAMLRRAGSPAPERHTLSLVAWCEGMLFSCTAGSYPAEVPGRAELRAGLRELLRGMLDRDRDRDQHQDRDQDQGRDPDPEQDQGHAPGQEHAPDHDHDGGADVADR